MAEYLNWKTVWITARIHDRLSFTRDSQHIHRLTLKNCVCLCAIAIIEIKGNVNLENVSSSDGKNQFSVDILNLTSLVFISMRK